MVNNNGQFDFQHIAGKPENASREGKAPVLRRNRAMALQKKGRNRRVGKRIRAHPERYCNLLSVLRKAGRAYRGSTAKKLLVGVGGSGNTQLYGVSRLDFQCFLELSDSFIYFIATLEKANLMEKKQKVFRKMIEANRPEATEAKEQFRNSLICIKQFYENSSDSFKQSQQTINKYVNKAYSTQQQEFKL